MRSLKNYLKLMRVKHYIKNVLCFLPLVFSRNLSDWGSFSRSLAVFACMCLGSSSVYIINDIFDAERDRNHPKKRTRPIASGAISGRTAGLLALLCIIIPSVALFTISAESCVTLLLYILINAAYSFRLKSIPVFDVFCIAMGFVLRVYAGAFAINVGVSNWLALTLLSLSFFMGFGKRRAEFSLADSGTREVLKLYSGGFLDSCMYAMMSVSIVFYALWSINESTISHLRNNNLIYTNIIVIIGLLRYTNTVEHSQDGDPTNILWTDRTLQLIMLAYVAAILIMIYL